MELKPTEPFEMENRCVLNAGIVLDSMLMKNTRLVPLFVLVATTIGCHGSGIDSSNARPTPSVVLPPNMRSLPMPSTSDHLESSKPAKKATAEGLLDESEATASRIVQEAEHRAYFLAELRRVSGEIRSPKATNRCVAAYEFARVHLNGCDSQKLQVKGITALSNVDARLAIELLDKVPNPCERGE